PTSPCGLASARSASKSTNIVWPARATSRTTSLKRVGAPCGTRSRSRLAVMRPGLLEAAETALAGRDPVHEVGIPVVDRERGVVRVERARAVVTAGGQAIAFGDRGVPGAASLGVERVPMHRRRRCPVAEVLGQRAEI